MKRTKTFVLTSKKIERRWYLVDLSGEVLGRVASRISRLLIGKDKPTYTPHLDSGDYVVAVNASQVRVTGNKADNKLYRWHTGYPQGLRQRSFNEMLSRTPGRIIEHAVSAMLPKNKLRSSRLRRLKVFTSTEHPYQNKINTSIE